MTKQQLALSAAAFSVTLALMACGGGSGGTSGSLSSNATTTTTQGVITGFGSVFVNGVEYFIGNSTSINMDGTDRPESDLQVGMLVTVQGTVNADGKIGMAKSIHYADLMEGVVTANAVSADGTGNLTVMGQTVTVTADTVFDSKVASITSPDLIQVGNVVEISGYSSNSGDVTATRIEVKAISQAAGTIIELKGFIANLDTINSTFTIGSLAVDYADLSPANLPSVSLTNGLYVEVRSSTPFDGTGSLIASAIRLKDDGLRGHEGHDGEDLEVRGLITADFADNQFELNGRTIFVDSNTQLVNGSTADLAAGVQIEIESHFDANGNLVADKIEFKQATHLELEGALQAVNTDAGTITLLGKVIYVDNNTIMMDRSDYAVRYFNLTDLTPANGDYLEVHAYQDTATSNLIATKVERKTYSTSAKIIGPVDSTTNGLIVLGITVDVSNAGSIPILNTGQVVKLVGTYNNDVFLASQLSLADATFDGENNHARHDH